VVTIGLVIAGVLVLVGLVLAVGILAGVWFGTAAFPERPEPAPPGPGLTAEEAFGSPGGPPRPPSSG